VNTPSEPSARAAKVLVEAAGLRKSFDGQEVIRGIDLTITEGQIIGLIGPSGCGKTTTVKMLAGLLVPTEGTASVFGRRADLLSSAQRQRIGYLPQTPALFPDLSLWENLSFHASMYGLRLRRKHRLRHVLDWVELVDDRKKKVREVSGGMQRRLALAAAFVHDPTLVFLDEPTAGIDPILRSKFWDHFGEMSAEGRTLLVTTQYVGEAAYCDYVGLMSDGELLMVDTPDNLRRAAFDGEVLDVGLASEPDDELLDHVAGIDGVIGRPETVDGRTLRVVVDNADEVTGRVDARLRELGQQVTGIDEHFVDYDEAFVRVIQRHRRTDAEELVDVGQEGAG